MGKQMDLDFRSPAEEACSVLLGWDARELERAPRLDGDSPSLRGEVGIALSGGEMCVAIDCLHRDAVAIASALLGAGDDETLPQEDVRDAFGELVNIIGGNIKGLMKEAVQLSIPSVHEVRSWRQLDVDLPGEPISQMWFAHEDHHLRVTVLVMTGQLSKKGEPT